jgi:diketogulonate reductase-like aldo/keto reductase
MEKVLKAGKARSIGVSNWKIPQLEKMLQYAEIPPAINQVEIQPFFPNTELIDFCFAHNILPAAYSPLGKIGEKVSGSKELTALAEKKNASLAQILIAWGIKRGYAVLPKSATESRIKSNFELVDLSDEEFEAVNKATERKHTRLVNPKGMFGYNPWPEEESST